MYRPEHPKPQFMRENWLNLNGEWQFEIDHGDSGEARGCFTSDHEFSGTINVPFCPESRLSGVSYTDFMKAVWYKRTFSVTPEQMEGRTVLHFGAVDYLTTVYVNGRLAGTHKGGYVSFSFDITELVCVGENVVNVRAQDDTRSPLIPSGKQSDRYASYGCLYTRTTGIWQTVWLEYTPRTFIESVKYSSDVSSGVLSVSASLRGAGTFRVDAFYEGRPMGSASTFSEGGNALVSFQLNEKHLWEIGKGRLYDLVLSYGDDTVKSYFGLRSVRLDGYRFLLNEKSIFQRLVLDQGFYPDGIYTAPDDKELEGDILRAQAVGFNGARLHEKVFEERFLYHCDRLGYIVWGEYPNWGLDHSRPESIFAILPEWMEEVKRDENHPSIIGWCPFNETWDCEGRKQFDDVLATVYDVTKALDPTRPCIDTSGNYHVKTDIFDIHNYEQDPEKFASSYHSLPVDGTFIDRDKHRQTYQKGMPIFISEYGGIRWASQASGWGYGKPPEDKEELLTRLRGLTDAILDNPCFNGYCYTQLTDVEQEQNGLYTYDRTLKFDKDTLVSIFSRKAKIEEQTERENTPESAALPSTAEE